MLNLCNQAWTLPYDEILGKTKGGKKNHNKGRTLGHMRFDFNNYMGANLMFLFIY